MNHGAVDLSQLSMHLTDRLIAAKRLVFVSELIHQEVEALEFTIALRRKLVSATAQRPPVAPRAHAVLYEHGQQREKHEPHGNHAADRSAAKGDQYANLDCSESATGSA